MSSNLSVEHCIYSEPCNMFAIIAVAERKGFALSRDFKELNQEVKKSEKALSGAGIALKQIMQKTNTVIRSLVTNASESYFSTPLGLCFQLLSLQSLNRAASVCKEWNTTSLDYDIQIRVWANYLQVNNPDLYAKYADLDDKRLMIVEGKVFVRLTFLENKIYF